MLGTYYEGFERFLEGVKASPKFNADRAGDPMVLDEMAADVNRFLASAKYALANGHLLTNTPTGMTPEDANEKNKEWFTNWEKYAEDNQARIQQMQDTVSQLHNSGRRDEALWWPVISPTSNLSLADKIDTLRRYGVTSPTSPTSQQFTMIDPIPDLPGFVPPVVDTRLPGFIPPSLEGLKQPEGFTPINPLTYGLPGFPVVDPFSQGLGQLPPTVAKPQDPLVLKFDPATGWPLPFSERSPILEPEAPSAGTPPAALYTAAGLAALAAIAPELAPLLARWGIPAILGASAAPAFGANDASSARTASGGVFSTGAAPYDAFNLNSSAPNTNTGYTPRFPSWPPLIESKPLEQEPDHADTFAGRFGNWTESSAGTTPAQASGGLGVPAPGSVGAVAPEDVRRLTRVNSSNAVNAFTSGTSPVPNLPPSEFNDRFGQLERAAWRWAITPDEQAG
jgi:hypothetical protein